ncbi:MFS transporter [Rhodoblastus sp.]|uniref:MFS transporter n=1 Tax=Rhodoblastus sp. TaxID=1962975 RepID=UPI003F983433
MRRMQWAAVVLCAAAIAVNYLDRSTIAIANPEIRKEFNIGAAQFGALQSVWSLCYAFAQIPIGLVVDRLGPRTLLGASLVLWSIAVAAGGLTASFKQLFVARSMLGITESPAYPTAVRVTSNWFQNRDRGVPTGVFNMGANIGTAIAPPLLTALMLLFGWRMMFILMGGVGLLAALVWFWLYRDPDAAELTATDRAYLDANKSKRGGAHVAARQWTRLFRFRTTWAMIFGAFCSGYGIWMYVTWLPGYLEGQHHIGIAQTGFLASIPLVCSIFGAFFGGYASDRLAARGVPIVQARKLPTALGYLGSGLFTALAAYSTTPGPAILWISIAMFLLWFAVAAKWTLITAVSPQDYCASCSSIQNFGSYLGGTCSPFITGLIVDKTGSFVLALALGSVIMIAGAAIYYFLVASPITDADLEASSPRPATA